jgi:hypothetical protein
MRSLADEIINEEVDNVRSLLQMGEDVNQLDEYGFTPLIEAAIADHVGIAKLLIDYGADVNQQDSIGGTPLHWAAENNNIQLCELLFQHRANPNAYTFAGQPALVMPLIRRQAPLKKVFLNNGADLSFAQDFINTKLLGHLFELVGTADLIDPHQAFVEVDFEGFFLEFSIGAISDSLTQFANHFASRQLRHFTELTHVMIDVFDRAAQLIKYQQYRVSIAAHQQKIDALLQQEPILIPVGYEGHAITFVKLGNILAKCDRREDSRLYDNIVLYQSNTISKDWMKKFMYEKISDEFINQELNTLFNLQPITELKIEAQIRGNCSWANVEAAIPTIFFLLLMHSDQKKEVSQCKNMALSFFHQWREWNKSRTLYFCIHSFKDSDVVRNVCKAEILAAILFQRCRYSQFADRERIESILAVLRQPPYEHVLMNYVKTYCYEGQSEEGREFMQMLKAYGYL